MQSFEWDEAKAESNLRKHGIDFEEAIQVFGDEYLLFELERYVDGEARWQAIGMIDRVVVMVVVHSVEEIGVDEVVGIISARYAEPHEKRSHMNRGDMGKIVRRTWGEMMNHKISPERLAEMAEIKDEDIDFSDIPPLTEKFWHNAVRERFIGR